MKADFFTAAIPEPVAILGVRLKPFTLGHVILLNRFGNAFGTLGRPTLDDLVQGIVICSQDYQNALADMDNPDLPAHVAEWQRRLAPRNCFGLRKPGLGFSPRDAMQAFADYVAAGSGFPIFSVDESKIGGAISVPMVQSVKVTLQSKMHLTEAELVDRPWGLCLWDYFTLHAIDGNCKIGDAEDTGKLQAMADAQHDRLVAMMEKN